MTKLFWTFLVVTFGLSSIFAQPVLHKDPVLPHGIKSILEKNQEPSLPEWKHQSEFYSPALKEFKKGQVWKWNQVIVTDTGGNRYILIRSYDDVGNILSELTQISQDSLWVNFIRSTFSYDANRKMVLILKESWQSEAWLNNSRSVLTYDSSGNIRTYVEQEWASDSWTNTNRYTYSFDVNGNPLTLLMERWQGDSWVNFQKGFKSYDTENRLLSFYWAEWVTNLWINQDKDTYAYDAGGNILTDLNQFWTPTGWANYIMFTNTYDAGDHQTSSIMRRWIVDFWMNWTRFTGTYDSNGNMLTYLTGTWNPPDSSWDNTMMNSFSYDNYGDLLTELVQGWQAGEWMNISRWSYTYDDNGNSVTGTYMDWQSGNWLPGMGTLVLYSGQKEVYSVPVGYTYSASYRSYPDGVNNIRNEQASLKVFPNPARENISIQFPDDKKPSGGMVSVYDIQGSLILQTRLEQQEREIDIRSLSKGVYFLLLSTSGIRQMVMFVKD